MTRFKTYAFRRSNMVTIDRINSDYTIYYDEQAELYRAMCNKCGGTSYSNSNLATALQNAIDALTNGGKIFIRTGTYIISDKITLKSHITLQGEGNSTVLKLGDNVNKTLIYLDSNAKYCAIKDLKLDGNKDNNTSGHGIHFYHTEWIAARTIVHNVHIWNTAEHGVYMQNYAGVILDSVRCFYNGESGVKLSADDNLINNLYVGWSNKSCLVITGHHNHIVNAHVWAGGQSNPSSGIDQSGIVLYGDRNTIESSESETNCRIGLLLQSASRNIITGCLLWNNGKSGFSNGRGIGIAGTSKYNIISHCAFYDYREPTYQELAINEVETSDYNQMINNDFSLNPSPAVSTVGAHTVIKYNTGFVTENSGATTISNGTSSKTVNHGLASTPTKIVVTGKHSEVANLYVDTIGSTQFTIHAKDGNVTADREVFWEAEV